MAILIFFVLHWYSSLFFQTFFLHRYAAHKMFTMSKTWERIFFVLTFIFQGSNYLSAYGYGLMHRLHHAHADTEKDPHSPKFSANLFDMMWKTKLFYSDVVRGRESGIEEKYYKDLPSWKSFDMFASNWFNRLAWGTAYVAFYYVYATEWWMYLLLPIHFLMSPVHGAIINWFAHKFGYRNFTTTDTSMNFLPFDFLMMGESYHNNHHKHGSRANFGGFRWHEIDPTYQIIKLFNFLGIIKLRNTKKELVAS
ncbi:acyl-CoA desaturase [Sediminitomix flava]|uniref:Stearoyl-CoA desaturase (Delta-9 desaturase) n=1 Tax=Sediminitomix flava TaxID=379075 RepID=A0A315Z8N6_SEDFL|nr:acyl-CoA desaturase [Sediminitomix flava]PWJ41861.1 stearoyl-CoA desaturase (delta-9 desaturase) [Sediminitomix flava]